VPSGCKPYCHDPGEELDSFELIAPQFQPLYHAMMALSALSYHKYEKQDRIDALEHYDNSIRTLRERQDELPSVQLIYTHYFLILLVSPPLESTLY